jgi:MarC family membrane protein
MDFSTINVTLIIDIFLLLLIGIGPKIALVPFLELTAKMDEQDKSRVVRKMLITASVTAILLMVFGGLLTKLLHFSTGALAIAGGFILLVISTSMILGQGEKETQQATTANDPMRLAVFPLAVPYLLNPAGIVVLVTVSAEAGSIGLLAIVLVLLALVIGIDIVVFRWAKQVSAHLDESRMLVTEKVFGFLLAALAVQLALDGLADLGVIHLAGH